MCSCPECWSQGNFAEKLGIGVVQSKLVFRLQAWGLEAVCVLRHYQSINSISWKYSTLMSKFNDHSQYPLQWFQNAHTNKHFFVNFKTLGKIFKELGREKAMNTKRTQNFSDIGIQKILKPRVKMGHCLQNSEGRRQWFPT